MTTEPQYPLYKMSVCVFSESVQTHWINTETLETREMLGWRTEGQQGRFVSGCPDIKLPTYGFSGTVVVNLNAYHTQDTKSFTGFEALTFLLSKQLQTTPTKAKELFDEALAKGFNRFLWCKASNLLGTNTIKDDEWLVLADYPQFDRDSFNELAEKLGSKWRLLTPKTEKLAQLRSLELLRKELK